MEDSIMPSTTAAPSPKALLNILKNLLPGLACCLLANSGAFAADAQKVISDAELYTVKVRSSVEYPFGSDTRGSFSGTGFLVDRKSGYILTNAHVASRSPSKLTVNFKSGNPIRAEKVYVDRVVDIAVIKIDPSKIEGSAQEATLDCSNEQSPGSPAIAYGHPWGLDFTATRGIVSGNKVSYGVEMLQTDAAINPGNSGGPLIEETTGKVIGVNTSKVSNKESEKIAFATPIRFACTILSLLRENRDPSPPILPIEFASTRKDREVVVAKVYAAWADKIKIGDRILAVDDDPTARFATRVIDRARGKDRVKLTIERGDTVKRTLTFDLPVPALHDNKKPKALFFSGMLIGPSLLTRADPNVMYIHHVTDASAADQAQFGETNIVQAVDGVEIQDFEQFESIIRANADHEVEFVLKRLKDKSELEYGFVTRRIYVEHINNIQ
jgi:serine protease Do